MIFTLTFNPAIDYTLTLEQLNYGKINRSTYQTLDFGGKGINVSRVLHELKTPSVALGFVAGFTGDAIEAGLQAEGIKTDFIHLQAGNSRINVKLRTGEETDINADGPGISVDELSALFGKLEVLTDKDMLVLAGSVPSSLKQDIYTDICQIMQKKNTRVVVDAAGKLLKSILGSKPYLIKPNHHELGELYEMTLVNADEVAYYAAKLHDQGVRNVLVSMAENGALLVDETGKQHKMDAIHGTLVNSVGAGDSMVAGFLAGLHTTGDFAYALKLGIAAGSATAFSEGLADKRKIWELFFDM